MGLCPFVFAVFALALFGLCRNFVPELLVRRVMASKQADAAPHNYNPLLRSIKGYLEALT
jgi:hypothetical protein